MCPEWLRECPKLDKHRRRQRVVRTFCGGLRVLHAHDVTQRCSLQRGELRSSLGPLSLLAFFLDERTTLLGENGHIARGVPDGVDWLELFCENGLAVEEGRLELVHHDVDSGLRLVLEVKVDLLSSSNTGREHAVSLPQVVVGILDEGQYRDEYCQRKKRTDVLSLPG